jgi:hypothetical protein
MSLSIDLVLLICIGHLQIHAHDGGLEPMPWNGPEKEREGCNTKGHEYRHPNGTAKKQLSYVWFTDAQGAERRCFTLSQEDEDGVEFVLM